MKSLSCFCRIDFCPHYDLGQIIYSRHDENRLNVTDVYSDSETEIPGCSRQTFVDSNDETYEIPGCSRQTFDSKNETFKNGDYVLVKFQQKKNEYRYVGVCSDVDEDEGEIHITFLRSCNDSATLFKVDEHDVPHIPSEQIFEKLPQPSLVLQGERVFLRFKEPVNIMEQ